MWDVSIKSVKSKSTVEEYLTVAMEWNAFIVIAEDLSVGFLFYKHPTGKLELLIGGYTKGCDLNSPFVLLERLMNADEITNVSTIGRKAWKKYAIYNGFKAENLNDGTYEYTKEDICQH